MALQEVGVEAVVKGLSAFQGDMRSMNSSLQSLRGEGTFLQQAFGSITDGIISFGESVIRVAETALGVLLRDAIRAAIDFIRELVGATIEAGNEFQTLELRLERLNFNALIESGTEYTQAASEAVEMTKEQLEWIQKLAAQSPYDSTDVANVYTLARSYGFAAEEADDLTEDILNFAAGMGLGNQEIERIIINFGQMVQQGKINGQELRDLARGAFVPVNDVLAIMMERMSANGTITADFTEKIKDLKNKIKGYEEDLQVAVLRQSEFTETTKESTKLANQFKIEELQAKIGESSRLLDEYMSQHGKAIQVTAENFDDLKKQGLLTGDAVKEFIGAFSDLVETRFVGAAEKMATTFKGATDNVLDLVKGIFGLNTVKPILDVLGEKISAFANAFTDDPQKWDRLVAAASKLGEALSSIVSGVLDLLPGTGDLSEQVIGVVERVAQWVEDNRENIIGFFRGIAETIRNDIVPFIQEKLIPAIAAFFGWITEHKDEILQFFIDLGMTIMEDIIPFVTEYLIPAFRKFSDWVVENKELILSLFDQLGDAVLELAEFFLPKLEKALQWIEENPEKVQKMIDIWAKWQVIGTILNVVGGIILGVVGFILSLIGAVAGVLGVLHFLGPVLATIGGLFAAITLPVWALILAIGALAYLIVTHGKEIGVTIQQLWFLIKYYFNQMLVAAFNLGVAIGTYLKEKFEELKEIISNLFTDFDWAELGANIVAGISAGIGGAAWMLIDAILGALGDAWTAAEDFLAIGSPSKLFLEMGTETMQGLALGIQKSAGMAAATMQGAMARVTSAAMPSVSNSTVYNNTANYNLSINSSAQTEPIVQDFEMMSSLAGV